MGKSPKISTAKFTAEIWQITSKALALTGTGSCSQDVFKSGGEDRSQGLSWRATWEGLQQGLSYPPPRSKLYSPGPLLGRDITKAGVGLLASPPGNTLSAHPSVDVHPMAVFAGP